MEVPILRKQSCRCVRRSTSSASSPITIITTTTTTTAALGGERIPIQSIYLHPLTASVSLRAFCASAPRDGRTHTHCTHGTHTHTETHTRAHTVVSRAEVESRFLSASPPRRCSRPPVLDHITSSALPARLGARWRPSCAFLSAPERFSGSRAALWSRRPAGQSAPRTQDARRTEEARP